LTAFIAQQVQLTPVQCKTLYKLVVLLSTLYTTYNSFEKNGGEVPQKRPRRERSDTFGLWVSISQEELKHKWREEKRKRAKRGKVQKPKSKSVLCT